jgi:hypothetical protein
VKTDASERVVLVVTSADDLETPERGGTVVCAAAPVPGAPVPLARLGG